MNKRRLVTDLENDVVVRVHLLGDLADVIALALHKVRMLECLGILEVALSHRLDVIFVIEGRKGPGIRVLRVEKTDLYHDAPLAGLRYEVLQSRKILGIPLVQVKLVPAEQVGRLRAAAPG
jgi:hypothetical protein